ncbi:FCD domain-containing protein [Bordetella sp. 02P26C-1]|nr:FCD domain-containing protein [Bordetella sp. 02P26C-1]
MKTAQSGTRTRRSSTQNRGSLRTFPVAKLDTVLRENLSTHVERHIRQALLAGHFAPGDRISLISIAETLGTSVTPVREAISRLAAAQALELVPGAIARVPAFDAHHYEELRDIRLAVECLAVERAALRVTKRELTQIKRALNGFLAASQSDEVEKMLLASRDFRFLIYEASKMPALVRVIEDLWLRTAPSFRLMYGFRTRDEELEQSYSKLFQALENHDATEARRIAEHTVVVGASRLIAMVGS